MMRAICILLLLLAPVVAQAQALYLAPYEGDGTDDSPFRGVGVGQGAQCKSLRSDEKQRAGVAICKAAVLPNDSRVIDVSNKRAIVKADRDKLLADYGLAVRANTFGSLLSELVDGQGVSLGRKDGRQRIILMGEEIWSRPAPLASYLPDLWRAVKQIVAVSVAWAAATLDEDWNCADDNTPNYVCDHTWVRYAGTTAELLTNSLRNVNSVGTNLLYNSSTLDSTDMRHRVTISTITRSGATNVSGGPGTRHSGNGIDSTYVYCVARDAATQQVAYGHVVAGSNTEDGAVNATLANGDTVEVQSLEDQLSCKHNGTRVLGPITENTGSGNVNVMVRFSGSGTPDGSTIVALDDSHAELATGGRHHAVPWLYP